MIFYSSRVADSPAAPCDVTVLEKSSDKILLQWAYDDVTGVTFWTQYRPRDAAAADDDDSDNNGKDDEDGDDALWMKTDRSAGTECTITGLQPATVYLLRVVAQNENDRTQSSCIISCRTDDLNLGEAALW